jgi:ferredoxin/flavodoxin---NADP+ reductase
VVGDHVRPAELADGYDAVIYALGAQSDRPSGIAGEDLPGSVAAVDFVGWYNAQ